MGPLGVAASEPPQLQDNMATKSPTNIPLSSFEDTSILVDESDTDEMAVNSPEEVDESLIELSISPVATRMRSSQTPAIEKAVAMEEGRGYFDSGPDSPPIEEQEQGLEEYISESPHGSEKLRLAEENESPASRTQPPKLPSLPSPTLENSALPTPWQAGPKPFNLPRHEIQPSLAGVFSSSRTRSRSGGAEALKKFLPKGLPSMSQVGNYFGSTTILPGQKSPNSSNGSRSNRSSTMFTTSSLHRNESSPQRRTFQSIITSKPQAPAEQPLRPKNVRRSTSDNSLLYHSLSRASSLGDDTRFEKQTEQVNSRAKAIRDSLQDRSSFRMPQIPSIASLKSMPTMPSMPNMPRVPSFSFNMSFLTANSVPAKWRNEADKGPDLIAGNLNNTRPSALPISSRATDSSQSAQSGNALPNSQSLNSFDSALESLTGDIVIMGGYRGSVLRSTKNNRQVWVPVKVGLNIRKVDLEVGLEPEDEERMEETIYPSGMLQNIGPVDISRRLFKRLSECENARNGKLRVWDYGYDWRLSPHLLSRKLTKFLEGLPSNQPTNGGAAQNVRGALVIAHSLGGLITRHVVNHRPELFSGVIYAGVPQACVNILGPLRNGDAVLLSSRVLTAQVNFTLRTSFLLLPEDGGCFIDLKTRERYPVDFFSLDDWIKYRLSPCTDPPLPPKNPPPSGGFGSLINMSSSLLSLPNSAKKLNSGPSSPTVGSFESETRSSPTKTSKAADFLRNAENGTDRTLAPQMGSNTNPVTKGQSINQSISTTVTIPRDKAITYLKRTLAETKQFKQELHFKPELSESNRYPPLALIYGKSIPTVYGAKVDGRDGIPCSDVYDNLAFASGDGVCLAKEAMLPEGYMVVRGGRVSSDRGHLTLLGDLNAAGRALLAVVKGRKKGIGMGDVMENVES
ncbi:hypothetical protein HYALB_00013694 [Hymenoscyphus albidus]|uniref:Uncharacterized protein n=1 Tax=Hymenoscyphus albidus TaxID=595503 RepID=A0A9N9QA61_9HELO|nr:hypothetical protein HYALB_00013694 [Hymenoscyphus albidus]